MENILVWGKLKERKMNQIQRHLTEIEGDDYKAMEARDLQWEESYHRVTRVLPLLTKRELDIIGDVVDEFVNKESRKDTSVETPIPVDVCDFGIHPLFEEEILAQVDRSLAQASRGEVRDAEEFEAEFDAELKAAYGI